MFNNGDFILDRKTRANLGPRNQTSIESQFKSERDRVANHGRLLDEYTNNARISRAGSRQEQAVSKSHLANCFNIQMQAKQQLKAHDRAINAEADRNVEAYRVKQIQIEKEREQGRRDVYAKVREENKQAHVARVNAKVVEKVSIDQVDKFAVGKEMRKPNFNLR